ncbi:hypothetical protein M5K25_026878 [Dendrobium thyrsiflorum]|uniref:Uncharacterized protein n=1 Tax=Dendrobium thyrsiflorum TaxID=117978 RepID=A0ABD0TYJ6_DENTH
MEEQMRLYIRLAMEDSGFHLHTSMDNNIYNLIIVTRFPSFDTSARMRTTVGTPILTDGDPVGEVRESTTTVVTPHTGYGDPIGRATESTPTVVTPHTNYGDPVGRVRKGKPTAVTPHTDYGDPVGKETESITTVFVHGRASAIFKLTWSLKDPVLDLIRVFIAGDGNNRIGMGDNTKVEELFLNATESPVLNQTHQETHLVQESWLVLPLLEVVGGALRLISRVHVATALRNCKDSVSAGRDPVFPSEVTTNFSLSYIFLIQEEEEMCSVGTTTEEGEEETGKVKVLATIDLAYGGLLSTASELCIACLIIPLVLRESASCHSSPELRGSGTTTGGTTGSSLDVVGVPTSITWGATPKAVNCAVIVAMALAISAICSCNCNTVASVSTERGGPPCAEVEVGRNVLPGLRRSQERLQHRGCEQLWGDVAPAVKGPLAAELAHAEPQKQPSPELLPQMQLNGTEQEGQELLQESPGSAEQSRSEKAWRKQKPGEKKEREARPEHPSSSKRKEEGRPEHESPLPERQLGELLADGAEGPEPV